VVKSGWFSRTGAGLVVMKRCVCAFAFGVVPDTPFGADQ